LVRAAGLDRTADGHINPGEAEPQEGLVGRPLHDHAVRAHSMGRAARWHSRARSAARASTSSTSTPAQPPHAVRPANAACAVSSMASSATPETRSVADTQPSGRSRSWSGARPRSAGRSGRAFMWRNVSRIGLNESVASAFAVGRAHHHHTPLIVGRSIGPPYYGKATLTSAGRNGCCICSHIGRYLARTCPVRDQGAKRWVARALNRCGQGR
jgi:hypothetical protein